MEVGFMGLLLAILITFSSCNAEQTIGEAAKAAVEISGASKESDVGEKLLRNLILVNVNHYLQQNEKPIEEGKEPPPPKRGQHPYEWDSIRTSETMLKDRDGGSCGTHGLSLAALGVAAGISSSDIRIIGTVNTDAYTEICPGESGEKIKTGMHDAPGHVFLQVKIGKQWYLFNTTHDPFDFPVHRKSLALKRYRELTAKCAKEDRNCFLKARTEASKLLVLDDFEKIPFHAPEEFDLSGKKDPILIDPRRFPSFVAPQNETNEPISPLLLFQAWEFKDYPIHTIEDRLNLVASGDIKEKRCRWSKEKVESLSLPPAPSPPPSRNHRKRK